MPNDSLIRIKQLIDSSAITFVDLIFFDEGGMKRIKSVLAVKFFTNEAKTLLASADLNSTFFDSLSVRPRLRIYSNNHAISDNKTQHKFVIECKFFLFENGVLKTDVLDFCGELISAIETTTAFNTSSEVHSYGLIMINIEGNATVKKIADAKMEIVEIFARATNLHGCIAKNESSTISIEIGSKTMSIANCCHKFVAIYDLLKLITDEKNNSALNKTLIFAMQCISQAIDKFSFLPAIFFAMVIICFAN